MRRDVENNQNKIITSIRENGPQTTTEMVESTGLSRDTINEYYKKLSKHNIVIKSSKFGKYCLTGDGHTHGYPSLKGQNFARKAMRIIFGKNAIYTNNDPRIQLRQFIDMIAGFVLYCLIQTLAPKVWNPNIDGIQIEEKTGEVRDKAARQWFLNCMNSFQILSAFSNLKTVGRGLRIGVAIPPPPFHIFIEHHCYRPANLSTEQKKKWQESASKEWNRLNSLYKKNKKRNFDPHDRYQSETVILIWFTAIN